MLQSLLGDPWDLARTVIARQMDSRLRPSMPKLLAYHYSTSVSLLVEDAGDGVECCRSYTNRATGSDIATCLLWQTD